MTWYFKDGTIAELGGLVRGNSALAQALRADVVYASEGGHVPVFLREHPCEAAQLDVTDARIVRRWLQAAAYVHKVELQPYSERLDLQRSPWQTPAPSVPGRIY